MDSFLSMLLLISVGINLCLLIGLGIFVRVGVNASRQLQAYENFYHDTLEDVNSVIDMIDGLMKSRRVLSDDPDVQHFYRIIVIIHDILMGYKNAGITKESEEKERQ